MTELQQLRARALADIAKSADGHKRMQNYNARKFVEQMAGLAANQPEREISPKQADYLKRLAWSHRYEIPAAVRPAQNPYESQLWTETEEA